MNVALVKSKEQDNGAMKDSCRGFSPKDQSLGSFLKRLIVADSCFAGKLTRSSLAKLRPGLTNDARMTMLKTIAKKRVRTAMTSGGEQPVLDTGGKGHSVFTEAFLGVLEENKIILETERLFWAIRTRVVHAASQYNMDQIPTYWPIQFAGHESLGDFIFVPRQG